MITIEMKWAVIEWTIRRLITSQVLMTLIGVMMSLEDLSQLPDETRKQYNDRRRRLAIDRIQQRFPDKPTSHLDIAVGFVAAQMKAIKAHDR